MYEDALGGKKTTLTDERIRLLSELNFPWEVEAWGDDTIVPWEYRFRDLRRYKSEHGHVNVPMSHPTLGLWVHKQRALLQRGQRGESRRVMTPDRARRLEELGFVVNPRMEKWNQRYEELRAHTARHGNCSEQRANKELRSWCTMQRTMYKKGTMTEERRLKLEELGFVWMQRQKYRERKSKKRGGAVGENDENEELDLLVDEDEEGYSDKRRWGAAGEYDENEELDLLIDEDEEGSSESDDDDNTVKQRLEGKTTAIRCELDRSGDGKGVGRWAGWDKRFEELRRYKMEHGHTFVPRSHPTLGSWVPKQRAYLQNAQRGLNERVLPPDRATKLEELGFVTNLSEEKWNLRYEELKAHRAKYGDCAVRKKENELLLKWCNTQRVSYKKGTMYYDRMLKLNELGFAWMPGKGYQGHRRADKERNGANVKDKKEEDDDGDEGVEEVFLSSKVGSEDESSDNTRRQRTGTDQKQVDVRERKKQQPSCASEKKRGEDSEEVDNEWILMYKRLRQYHARYGNCLVPKEYTRDPELGRWVEEQRIEAKKVFEGKKSCLTYGRFADLGSLEFRFVL